jgi:N-acetyl-1-D-myo-inositol-2-amino-2-deoxy-alpha-D-glucopyranoside deacetylase
MTACAAAIAAPGGARMPDSQSTESRVEGARETGDGVGKAGRALLVAVAHPDDETFGMGGTMALFAERGWRVTIVCATRGEVGEISDPSLATPETLGQVREQELRNACRILGVDDVRFLEYRDSGMAGTPENADQRALCNADPAKVTADFAAILRDVQPAVVLTWDPSGGYGHPDHIAVHRYATAAFEQTPAAADAALYYTALPVHLFEEMAIELRRQGIEFGSQSMREQAARLPRLPVTTEIDVLPYAERKAASFKEHRTQTPPDSFFEKLSPELRRRFAATEYFHRVAPAWRDGDPIEHEFVTVFRP